jgi:large subunit ribosomal protein L28
MAQQCAICGKLPVAGNNVSHSKVRTRRRFMPNLQAATVVIGGKRVKARVCTRCLRTSTKHAAV